MAVTAGRATGVLHRYLCRGKHTASSPSSLRPGDRASDTRRISRADLRMFAALCGDHNPVHSTGIPAGDGQGARVLVHGAFLNSLASAVIGTKLPGPGTIVVGQNLRFPRPCLVDEEVTTVVEVKEVRKIVEVTFRCVVNIESDDPKVVLEGNAKLILADVAPRGDDAKETADSESPSTV